MSAESLVDSVIATAIQQAVQTTDHATVLLNDAVGYLNKYQPTYPTETITFSPAAAGWNPPGFVWAGSPATETTGLKPPALPSIHNPVLPVLGTMTPLGTITATFNEGAPSLNLPSRAYREPSEVRGFEEDAPRIDTRVDLPDKPKITLPDKPTLTSINPNITFAELVLPLSDFATPIYRPGTLKAWDEVDALGHTSVAGVEAYARTLVDEYFPARRQLQTLLSTQLAGVLSGTSGALSDSYEEAIYQSAARKAELARTLALERLNDETTRTGWDLPGKVRFAGQVRLNTDFSNALGAAALDAYTRRREQEIQHLQMVMQLADRMQGSAVDLFAKGYGLALDSVRQSLAYAVAVGEYVQRIYQLRQADFELESKLLDAAIRVFEARLKAELAKTEIAKAKLSVEQLKAEVNKDLVSLYTSQIQAAEALAQLYATQISSAEAELKIRMAPLEVFKANSEAYRTYVEGKKAEYGMLEAQIAGDNARTEGELAKLKVYSTKADVFRTVVSAEAASMEAKAKRNQEVLEEYKVKIDTEMKLVGMDHDLAKYSLDSYEVMAKVFLAEVESKLKEKEFEYDKELQNAKMELAQREFLFNSEFKSVELELARVKAQSEINQSAAQTYGAMANAALSAMNGVAAAVVNE